MNASKNQNTDKDKYSKVFVFDNKKYRTLNHISL